MLLFIGRKQKTFFFDPKNTDKVCIGDTLLVQISREAFKTKPATATGKLSLTGEYVVLVSDGTGISVSGKVKKHPHCLELKEKLEETFYKGKPLPAFGFILRTEYGGSRQCACIGRSQKTGRTVSGDNQTGKMFKSIYQNV